MPTSRRAAVVRRSGVSAGTVRSLRSTSSRARCSSASVSTSASASCATSSATPLRRSSTAMARRASPRPVCRDAHPLPGERGVVDQPDLVEPLQHGVRRLVGDLALAQRLRELLAGAGAFGEQAQADLPRDRHRVGLGLSAFPLRPRPRGLPAGFGCPAPSTGAADPRTSARHSAALPAHRLAGSRSAGVAGVAGATLAVATADGVVAAQGVGAAQACHARGGVVGRLRARRAAQRVGRRGRDRRRARRWSRWAPSVRWSSRALARGCRARRAGRAGVPRSPSAPPAGGGVSAKVRGRPRRRPGAGSPPRAHARRSTTGAGSPSGSKPRSDATGACGPAPARSARRTTRCATSRPGGDGSPSPAGASPSRSVTVRNRPARAAARCRRRAPRRCRASP